MSNLSRDENSENQKEMLEWKTTKMKMKLLMVSAVDYICAWV